MIKSSTPPYKFDWFDWFCLWYPPGWLIIFNRHWQHYHEDPDGWNWLEYVLFLIPGGFYLAFFMRWLRLGCCLPSQETNKFDPDYQEAFCHEVLKPIVEVYFQAELHSEENLPENESLLVIMNHAGMSFPWDFLSLAYLLNQKRQWKIKPLAGVSLFEHSWMKWWLPLGWSQVLGGVRAKSKDFEAAVAEKNVLVYAPEGLRGPMKGWPKRYQLQTFHPSFVQLCDRYSVPILPVACIGNEFLHPWAIHSQKLANLLSMPFLPLSFGMIALILFPSMGVWAMKTKLRYYVQHLVQPNLEEQVNTQNKQLAVRSSQRRSKAYQKAQQFREKLQLAINQQLED
ncbi:MAG: 1-acyl-sn-glycerol-3-phosphate acyltransferase [Halothece sp.]